jgi:hypothetical protein
MTISLIFFFTSLLGMIILFGRKLLVLEGGEISTMEQPLAFEITVWQEVKRAGRRHLKRYGYKGLVITVKLYMRSASFLKQKQKEMGLKIKDTAYRYMGNRKIYGGKQVSKFGKLLGEFRYKLRRIKHQIAEEENNF